MSAPYHKHAEDHRIKQLEAENAALKATNAYLKGVRDEKLLAAQHRNKVLREAWDDLLEDLELHGMHDFEPYKKSKARFKADTPDNTAELDALVKDAARYRWLREDSVTVDDVFFTGSHEVLDAAIDAAIKETPNG